MAAGKYYLEGCENFQFADLPYHMLFNLHALFPCCIHIQESFEVLG